LNIHSTIVSKILLFFDLKIKTAKQSARCFANFLFIASDIYKSEKNMV